MKRKGQLDGCRSLVDVRVGRKCEEGRGGGSKAQTAAAKRKGWWRTEKGRDIRLMVNRGADGIIISGREDKVKVEVKGKVSKVETRGELE